MGKLETAEMVLVGTGEEFEAESSQDILSKAYEKLAQLLAGKNYFVITTGKDDLIMQSGLKVDRIVQPLLFEEDSDQMPPMWDKYTKWLQGTLNRNVLILELGVGLKYPGVIRFPFEKAAYFNKKADFIRVHGRLYQMTEELGDKGISIAQNAVAFLAGIEI
ncbi:MAG: hypothetical protein MSH20_07805 [Lachnospiraceae bacterium]|nr:hypothetical protein [Lachnospiraceae bacterium]